MTPPGTPIPGPPPSDHNYRSKNRIPKSSITTSRNRQIANVKNHVFTFIEKSRFQVFEFLAIIKKSRFQVFEFLAIIKKSRFQVFEFLSIIKKSRFQVFEFLSIIKKSHFEF
jgi:hypothetical protein